MLFKILLELTFPVVESRILHLKILEIFEKIDKHFKLSKNEKSKFHMRVFDLNG